MSKQTCHWRGCKQVIEVEQISNNSMFVTVGWCDTHQQAFRIYTELEKKYAKDHKIDWPIGSLSYKKHKKALHQLHELAGHRAEQEAKHCLQ